MPQSSISSFKGFSRRAILQTAGVTALTMALPGLAPGKPLRAMRYGVSPTSDNDAKCHVAAHLLREHYGYDVEVIPMAKAVEYVAMGEGKIDVMTDVYLEGKGALQGEIKGGHAAFVEKIKDKIDFIGISEGPMDQGFVIPRYVDCRTMEDLGKNREKFGGKILGGDPSWGLSQAADRVLKAYNLNFDLLLSSEDAMLAGLKRAYARKEWICITGWRVHPMWAQFELKYIEDPKKAFGDTYWTFAIVQKNFSQNFPEAHKFFQKYHIPNPEMEKIMLWLTSENMKSADAAARWVNEVKGKGIIESWFS
jgi:glycine betaine/proline transport system substrate-binding protein